MKISVFLLALFCSLARYPCVIQAINDPDFEIPHRGCYFTNWSQYRKGKGSFTVHDINPSLCTYIVVAFGKIDNTTLTTLEWNDEETFRQLVELKESYPRLKILLSVGGWTLSNSLALVAATSWSRQSFATSSVKNLRYWELDGLDIDWEYPNVAAKSNYSALLMDLRTAFENEARESGRTRLALAAAVHFTSDGGYDGLILNQTLDFVNVMTYDLHGAWIKDKVGHHAPLFKGPFGTYSKESVSAIVKAWEHLGISKKKLVIGLPMYGRGWELTDSQRHNLGAPANGPIEASNFTGEAGAWPYYEICERFSEDNASYVFDESIQAGYAFTSNFWMGFDDRATILAKTKWVKMNGLGGVYIWDLAQDDFLNSCRLGAYPLLTAIYEVLVGVAASWIPPRVREITTTPATTRITTIPPASSTTQSTFTTIAPVQETVRHSPRTSSTRGRVAFPLVGAAITGKPTVPKPSFGKKVCDKTFCTWNGPGSFAVGKCEVQYCDCDAGSNPYSRECIGGLVYDTVSKYCNWQENVQGCTRFSHRS